MNVREKSKQLVALLKDDERLRAERARALKAKERFAQATARIGSETLARYGSGSRRDSYGSDAASPRGEGDGASGLSSELECARPQTAGEEELQLQLALAMSKEEAEQEERVRKNDDLRLQMALSESQQSAVGGAAAAVPATPLQNGGGASSSHQLRSGLDDLLGLSLGAAEATAGATAATDPWGMPLYDSSQAAAAAPDPWGSPSSSRPSGAAAADNLWVSPTSRPAQATDPWAGGGAAAASNGGDLDEFDILSKRSATTSPTSVAPLGVPMGVPAPNPFAAPLTNAAAAAATPLVPAAGNPFQASKPPPPTINQLRSQNSAFPSAQQLPLPMATSTTAFPPSSQAVVPPQQNPFM